MILSILQALAREPFSRRQAFQLAGAAALGLAETPFLRLSTGHAEQAGGRGQLTPLNRFPRMVQEFFVEQVRRAEQRGLRAKNGLKTKADAEAYVRSVQDKIRRCFGPEPERTPLRPRVTGVVERDAYQIEKVIFESRPGFLVTANLYVPRGRKFPLPGVVGSCGHSSNGKAADTYQSFAQGLARLGYVVLIFDPIGQGERLQYTDKDLRPRRGIGVAEHLHAGNQQFLVGGFFGAWRAWDGIRALDYLLSRKEVDPRHVGITGNSGGGTMTTWLCGLDRRWTMAAPGCFVTTFRRNLENELPADTEQCPPQALALSLDHDDFLAALAPKPIIILAKERDFFDVRGSIEAHARLKRLYTLLGAPDRIQLQIGPSGHGYSQENREAMYQWFNRATGVSETAKEPLVVVEKDQTLWCTPHGQVAELKSRTVFSFTREKSQDLTRRRAPLEGAQLARAVADVLKPPARPAEPPEFRILRPLPARGYPRRHATTYAVETEPSIFAVVTRLANEAHYSRPPKGSKEAVLYVAHQSTDAELREEPLVRELLAAHRDLPFYAFDVRGIGESRPDTCGADQFRLPYGSDYFYAVHALMLDRPYVGQKTHDVLRVLDWLAGFGHSRIHLVARGWGALPATFAALLSDGVERVTLKEALSSYAAVAESEDYDWPLSAFVPAVLAHFDLPDCYRELAKHKALRQVDPRPAQ
jgi:dienelactone hydrolase/pimeloyl-ACP methyl ester carboxylesterase